MAIVKLNTSIFDYILSLGWEYTTQKTKTVMFIHILQPPSTTMAFILVCCGGHKHDKLHNISSLRMFTYRYTFDSCIIIWLWTIFNVWTWQRGDVYPSLWFIANVTSSDIMLFYKHVHSCGDGETICQ